VRTPVSLALDICSLSSTSRLRASSPWVGRGDNKWLCGAHAEVEANRAQSRQRRAAPLRRVIAVDVHQEDAAPAGLEVPLQQRAQETPPPPPCTRRIPGVVTPCPAGLVRAQCIRAQAERRGACFRWRLRFRKYAPIVPLGVRPLMAKRARQTLWVTPFSSTAAPRVWLPYPPCFTTTPEAKVSLKGFARFLSCNIWHCMQRIWLGHGCTLTHFLINGPAQSMDIS